MAIINFGDVYIYILGIVPGVLQELTHFITTTAIWRKFHYSHIVDEVTQANRDVKNFLQSKTARL